MASSSASTSAPPRSRRGCSTRPARASPWRARSTGWSIPRRTGPSSTPRPTGRRRTASPSGAPWRPPARGPRRRRGARRLQPGRDGRPGRRRRAARSPRPWSGWTTGPWPSRSEIAAAFGEARVYDVDRRSRRSSRRGPPARSCGGAATSPRSFAAARRFLLVEDLLLHRLTGRFVTEGGVHCTSLLYDIREHRWWDEMLEAVGIDAARLPELARPGEVVGAPAPGRGGGARPLAPGARGRGRHGPGRRRGRRRQRPGRHGLGEHRRRPHRCRRRSTATAATPAARRPVYVHSAPGMYLYCPVCPTGRHGAHLVPRPVRRRGGGAGRPRGRERLRPAHRAGGGGAARARTGLLMLPHLMGAFSPEYEPEARGAFYGFTLRHGKGHFVRAVLEAVAFMLRRNLELLAGAGATADEIRSHGGGARSTLWNQVKADVCGLPGPDPGRRRRGHPRATRCWPASRPASSRTSTRPGVGDGRHEAAVRARPGGARRLRRGVRPLHRALRGAPAAVRGPGRRADREQATDGRTRQQEGD